MAHCPAQTRQPSSQRSMPCRLRIRRRARGPQCISLLLLRSIRWSSKGRSMSISRRRFLSITCRSAVSIGAFGAFSRFGVLNAFAQQTSNYKALVCVFLFGGNDGNNTVIPFDTAGYQNYATLRGGSNGVALLQSSLLPIQPASASTPFALHPRLTEIQSLFTSGKAAIVANVGTLVAPTTRTQYLNRQVQVPANLFSHADQQNQMQTAAPDSKLP